MGSQVVLAPSEFRFLQPLERRVEKLHGDGSAGNSNMEDDLLSSPPCAMQRQVSVAAGGSLDQVWRDIHRPNFQTTQAAAVENFLAQTGLGQREDEEEEEEEDGLNRGNNGSLTIFAMDSVLAGQNLQQPEWLQFQHQHQQFGELSAQANSNIDIPVVAASSSSEHPVWKKRGCESITYHTVELRQKRMIKNRESVARSRARRQISGATMVASNRRFLEHELNSIHTPLLYIKDLKGCQGGHDWLGTEESDLSDYNVNDGLCCFPGWNHTDVHLCSKSIMRPEHIFHHMDTTSSSSND